MSVLLAKRRTQKLKMNLWHILLVHEQINKSLSVGIYDNHFQTSLAMDN